MMTSGELITSSVPRTVPKPVASLKPIQSADELARDLEKTQPQRWADFHASSPIIWVLDDNVQTANRIARSLDILYGENIHVFYLADEAYCKFLELQEAGEPLPDALVLDLHMPGMSGISLIKKLGNDCPAVVINTAASMSASLADLSVQMDGYRSSKAAALISEHVADGRSANIPLVPIFIHLKDEGPSHALGTLVNKIDSAMLVSSAAPGSTSGIGEFLEIFEARQLPISYSEEAVHYVLEELRNFLSDATETIETLLHDHKLDETPWWQQNSTEVLAGINELGKFHFHNTYLDKPELTYNRMHGIVNHLMNISFAGLENSYAFENYSAHTEIYRLQASKRDSYERISKIAKGFQKYNEGDIDLRSVLKTEALNRHIEVDNYCEREDIPTLNDKDGKVRALIGSLLNIVEARDSQDLERGTRVSFDYTTEGKRTQEEPALRIKLEAIEAGDYCEVHFFRDSEQPLHKDFESLFPSFSELRNSKRVHWDYSTDNSGTRFILYIKASHQDLKFSEHFEQVRVQAKNISFYLDNLPVYEGLGPDSNITCIGPLPGMIEIDHLKDSNNSAMVFRYQDQIIFASAEWHQVAAYKILAYLEAKNPELVTELDDEGILPGPNQIYHEGTRVNYFSSAGCLIEQGFNDEKMAEAQSALTALGMLPSRVSYSSQFGPRD